MTQDEIIELARQAGFDVKEWGQETLVRTVHSKGYFVVINKKLETFAQLIGLQYEKKIADLENIICRRYYDVLQEREACAKVCEGREWGNRETYAAQECATAIRARGQA